MYGLSAVTTLITVSVVGGIPFIIVAVLLGALYYNGTPTDAFQSIEDSRVPSSRQCVWTDFS
jgi:hypothetical protein